VKQAFLNFIRSKNLWNATWSSLDAVVYPTLMLLATPVFISKLGVELYGLWMFVNTIVASIGVLNIGLGDATVKFISKYLVEGNRHKVNKVIEATYAVYLVLCAAVLIVTIILAFIIREYNWLNLPPKNNELIFKTIQIAGVTLGLKFIEQIFLAVFKGFERYDLSAKLSLFGKVTSLVANLVLVTLDYSLLYIFISSCVITAVYLFVEGWMVYRFTKFTSFIPSFDKKYIREIFSFGIWTWFQSIIGIASGQVDKFIVLSLSDIKVFAYYSLALTVFTQIHSFFSASISWIFPVISKKVYAGERVDFLYNKIQFYFLSIVTLILSFFYVVKDPFILYWLKEDTYKQTIDFISLFVCYNLVMATTIIPYYFLNSSNYFRLNTIFMLINLASRAVFIPLMFRFMETKGLVVGLIVSGLVVSPIQMYFFNKKILSNDNILNAVSVALPGLIFLLVYTQNNIVIDVLCLIMLVFYYKLTFRSQIQRS
jgi:O-antigen/teichoic acid export membrane protein